MTLHRRAGIALLALALACPAGAQAAADLEPFRVTVSGAWQVERLNAPYADSLGLTMTHSNRTEVEFDFRVIDAPIQGDERPALHVTGEVVADKRAVAVLGVTAGPTPVAELPVSEFGTGLLVTVPLSLVTPGSGVRACLGYRGSVVLAGGTSQDFLHVKQATFGFERTRGVFEGTLVEEAWGTNESWGLDGASGRWATRCRIQLLLGPTAASPGKSPAPSPLRLFGEIVVDTDGGAAADDIRTQLGIAVDAGAVLARTFGH